MKLGTIYDIAFSTTKVDTWVSTNADTIPVVRITENGSLLAYTPTVALLATGLYIVTIDASAANGFEVWKRYTVYASATVDGITWIEGIDSIIIETRNIDDVLPTWSYSTSPTVGQIRTELATELARIDTAVSTRMATFSYTTPPTVWAIRSELATELARLDVAVSTRMATFVYTTPPTVGQIRTELSTELWRIDTPVSTRMATFSYTAPDNTGISAIKTKTDLLTFTSGNLHSVAKLVEDKTGYALTSGERTAIAVAVESAILNEADGKAILNAIIWAIGNQNIDEIALVWAIRADIERTGGMLDIIPILSQIEWSSILAKEATVSTKASQSSINSIPTNPLLTSDIRLNNLDAPISWVSSWWTAWVTLVEIEWSTVLAKQASVLAIPTNPLLTGDTRLNRIDASISSRATPADLAVTLDGWFSAGDRATLETIPTLAEIEWGTTMTNIEAKLDLLERMERATVRISWTQLIMEDSIGEIQRWNMKDISDLPTSSAPYKKEKI